MLGTPSILYVGILYVLFLRPLSAERNCPEKFLNSRTLDAQIASDFKSNPLAI